MSFNDWLDQYSGDDVERLRLASFWKRSRGRLTRETVERRALDLRCPPGTGYAAWDAYIAEATVNTPTLRNPKYPHTST